MGYSGGTTVNPDYENIGDHSETVQVDYDPTRITYEQLLEVFWQSHDATIPEWSPQYRSAIFYHDAAQQEAAEHMKARLEDGKRELYTRIIPFDKFYLAEGYHQKYELRLAGTIASEYQAIYPRLEDFINSTAVTRANAYAGGNGSPEQLEKDITQLGLSTKAQEKLRDQFSAMVEIGAGWCPPPLAEVPAP